VGSFECDNETWDSLKDGEFSDQVTNCQFLNICTPQLNIIRMIKSKRMRWAGHVECMAERRSA
jgi:hypothetical protein